MYGFCSASCTHPLPISFTVGWSLFFFTYNISSILLLTSCQVELIGHSSSSISIPELYTSQLHPLKALVEHGIGCVIVFEYLFFQLQVKDRGTIREDLQQDLTLIVQKYQKSGVQEIVNACIAEAFQQHGDRVDDLCPMLVGIAQANQMCKTYSLPQCWKSYLNCPQQRNSWNEIRQFQLLCTSLFLVSPLVSIY
ncbi:hypothetical protein F5J12DRAFT_57838 [Pisolithus orientalis]|uniref:uncharacterized protein n=1 Tax=Pisolithus orientalis TaxID=936130 RepID=UPI002224977C|nr:uncharacterized protein F5J12DRAFT_57838 [Pisolithus orientalis]KAI6008887.1 hypothetical protein F5J12DRAFT_57838 [Pisolithus orientalis]